MFFKLTKHAFEYLWWKRGMIHSPINFYLIIEFQVFIRLKHLNYYCSAFYFLFQETCSKTNVYRVFFWKYSEKRGAIHSLKSRTPLLENLLFSQKSLGNPFVFMKISYTFLPLAEKGDLRKDTFQSNPKNLRILADKYEFSYSLVHRTQNCSQSCPPCSPRGQIDPEMYLGVSRLFTKPHL